MKFCVIGVGRFGYHVATTLADHGMEVLAVDSSESIIAAIRDKVTQAICLNVTDEQSLRSIGVEDMDTVIVAMGENVAQSILVTALLKQKLNVTRVVARSISTIHRDILTLIGADQVVLPEQEMGMHLADLFSLPFSALMRLTPQFSISQLKAPRKFVGKTLQDLHLEQTYHVICIGHKEGNEIVILASDFVITDDTMLILAGKNQDLEKCAKLYCK